MIAEFGNSPGKPVRNINRGIDGLPKKGRPLPSKDNKNRINNSPEDQSYNFPLNSIG
jgi:hypothetical protein